MKKLIPILLPLLTLTSCMGYHHRGPFSFYGFIFFLIVLAVLIVALRRERGERGRGSNLRLLLIVAAVILLWPIIGFLILPVLAVSMGLFFFFPPLLLLILILVLVFRRRDR